VAAAPIRRPGDLADRDEPLVRPDVDHFVVPVLAEFAVAEDFRQFVARGVQARELQQVRGGQVAAHLDFVAAAVDGDGHRVLVLCLRRHEHSLFQ